MTEREDIPQGAESFETNVINEFISDTLKKEDAFKELTFAMDTKEGVQRIFDLMSSLDRNRSDRNWITALRKTGIQDKQIADIVSKKIEVDEKDPGINFTTVPLRLSRRRTLFKRR